MNSIQSSWRVRCVSGLLSALCLLAHPALSHVVTVPMESEGRLLGSNKPTLTFHWPAAAAQATLILIPGGEGHIGLTPDRKSIGGFYRDVVARLSSKDLTSGQIDVVIFDNPWPLSYRGEYPDSRATADHLERIDSVVRHFAVLRGHPVWLMGHSNGAVSLTEYHAWLSKQQLGSRIAGYVISAGRYNAGFQTTVEQPVLYLHHQDDACPRASADSASHNHKKTVTLSRSRVEIEWVRGGQDEAKSPCGSGKHMYSGAGAEAARLIEKFILP